MLIYGRHAFTSDKCNTCLSFFFFDRMKHFMSVSYMMSPCTYCVLSLGQELAWMNAPATVYPCRGDCFQYNIEVDHH